MKKALILAAVAMLVLGSSANATTITLSTPGIVGLNDLNSFNDNAADATRLAYANAILGYPANYKTNPYPVENSNIIGYQTGPVDYSGPLTQALPTNTQTNIVPAGYQFALAKYDGPNAGYVLFYLPTYGNILPINAGFADWDGGATSEYGLSGWTVFNAVGVPDGGSVALLLGAALMGLAAFRRFVK